MPTATPTRNRGKTGFVKEYLHDHPQANSRSVNQAWEAAGFEGTISPSLLTQVRSQLGLTGNLPKQPEKKARAKTGSGPGGKKHGRRKGVTGRGGNQGKTTFVTEHLRQDPGASDEQINEAWASAGNEGDISGSLMSKIRAKEGLTGQRRARSRAAGKQGRSQASKGVRADRTTEPVSETPKSLDRRTNRGRIIEEFEGDIDRLIFKLMSVGGLETIEDELRQVRRLLYRTSQM
jgi:hypothetical protein